MSTSARLSAKTIKETGAHYTPLGLAQFLAGHVEVHLPKGRASFQILDPACGDGELLYALAQQLPPDIRKASTFVGMEGNDEALTATKLRLSSLPDAPKFEGLHGDFLEWSRAFSQPEMFESVERPSFFDAVIANPPYVRTQVMGGHNAKKLATQFGLTGRVDLYHAFGLAMTSVLRDGGVLGLLCSNRFLSIQSGASLRKVLVQGYELHDIFDLGDTKLFEAAVLPAIVIGTRNTLGGTGQNCKFTRVYELREPLLSTSSSSSDVLSAVESGMRGPVCVEEMVFVIERGTLAVSPSDHSEPWRISSPEQESWLTTVKSKAVSTFADLVKIRVGIKTTADNVFIRSDWSSLPLEMQPEASLLRPLLSQETASQWRPLPDTQNRRVLYTHTIEAGKRAVIDLENFPRAKRYLESHREQLEGRKYVIEGGRRWYEIWVPQNPADWEKPKVVFPDISVSPRFYLDESGSIVDGNCYWFTAATVTELYLLLAVANSSFTLRFYDAVCGNKLYAGRRRFITQYVERFPVPDLRSELAVSVVTKTERICALSPAAEEAKKLIREVDSAVWRLFGLEEITG